jgi:hypothetical protein
MSRAASRTTTERIEIASSRQHYATFTVALLLNADNSVRRMRVVHVQSGEELICAGWDEGKLITFMTQRIKLRLPTSFPAQSHGTDP